MTTFASLALPEPLARACEALGYAVPTPIQAAALPPGLEGRDLLAQARTGSGKTAAFGLPLLARVAPAALKVQAIVLCPTRELADQVAKELRALGRFLPNLKLLTLCGGIPLRPQLASLEVPPDVVVGTPGRILELIEKGALALDGVRTLVLDEADRMLDMGFLDDIQAVVKRTPEDRQTLLFSATFDGRVRGVAERLLLKPVEITIEDDAAQAIEQVVHRIDAEKRHWAVAQVLADRRPEAALVFCNTKRDVALLWESLEREGFAVDALHGDLEQREREEVLVRFANGSVRVLVATDVAARGLDIAGLPLVISADLASDPDAHVHRIGRTGRAGLPGLAVALASDAERSRLAAIEEARGAPIPQAPLALKAQRPRPQPAAWRTLQVDGGRQDKLRPGDLMGALTGAAGLPAEAVGKIALFPTRCYVAIASAQAEQALAQLRRGKIKARTFRVRIVG